MKDFFSLGETLKNTRIKMGLSLGEVSDMTGVSKAMLSQIERSESIPTLSTVWKIANGLKVKFETLIIASINTSSIVYNMSNVEDITPLVDDDGRALIYCTSPFSPISGVEIFYGILKPGCKFSSEGHRNGKTEHLFVFQGEVELIVGKTNNSCYQLKAGSTIVFDSKEEHTYVNIGEEEAHVHFVLSYE